jgi:hypothetical protein
VNPLQAQFARIEALVSELSTLDGPARAAARELVSAVLEVHRSGLTKLFEQLQKSPAARAACLDDPVVTSLLLLHDIHPDPLEVRVRRALDDARVELRGNASFELLAVHERQVRVCLTVHDSGASSARARQTAEDAICKLAPDALEVRFVDENGRLSLPVVPERAS